MTRDGRLISLALMLSHSLGVAAELPQKYMPD